MQLVFVLSFLALCIAVRGQPCTDKPFVRDPTWVESRSKTSPPRGFPTRAEQDRLLRADPTTAALLRSRQASGRGEPSNPRQSAAFSLIAKKPLCPFDRHCIWYRDGCWIVWPNLTYVTCNEPRTCTHCETNKPGRCREDCYFRYPWICAVCRNPQNGQNFLKWLKPIWLPQFCECRLKC